MTDPLIAMTWLRSNGHPRVSGVGDTEDAPGVFRLTFVGGASAEEVAAAEAAFAARPWLLPAARAARLADLDAWYAGAVAGGVTVSGVTLEATVEAQNRFDALTTMALAAISVGAATAATPFTAYAIDGSPVTLPAGQLMGLMLQYGQACAALAGLYSACKAAVLAAATPEAAAAVPLPG